MGSVLIAYATRSGAAHDIARALEAPLRQGGHRVRLASLADAPTIDGADLVVVGSGINATVWYPEASAWLDAHQAALLATKVAVFNTCLNAADPSKREEALGYNRPAVESVDAAASESFAGRYVKEEVGFFQRLLLAVLGKGSQDHVDTAKAAAWARELLTLMRP
ncbi:hypothetical protein G7070_10520 [Propioniciclava coleopterorum]|uniref:Flavodoxin-like domain-containing protein n=1 Tax=Propioniciclava coleopterorum TaxID=2714937 RepID=A0A6G7Y727_9ACTN|nr:flavodoxin domain-containing protein [Propioniciclava coleopterorum]QIK72622.1 hypothetical protein G7070_10520 [Propioniciclava coleopterorum]